MKKIVFVFILFASLTSNAQDNYWQQYLHYSIEAALDDKENSITGSETISYINNSPDTLNFIWFHLYPNAYKDESTALFQQVKNDPLRKENTRKFTGGFITNLAFTVNGEAAKTEAHPNPQYIDIIKVLLNKPLSPGDSVVVATPFKVQLPYYFSRSGYADGEFMVCQWYPKPAVYDPDGWHEMPYLDRGEFYSEYASYKVNITVPAAYVVGATGVLLTAAEENLYKKIGSYNAANRNSKSPMLYVSPSSAPDKTVSYYADSVPDFAWFAEKGLVIEYDTIRLPSGNIADAFTYYHQLRNTPWTNSIDFVKDAVHHYTHWIGEYAYPVVQAIEGPANNLSGGMEYPTITLITSPNAEEETLDAVIAHEVGHNWFMSMLGTNEREHAWMDEGLNTYYEFRYEAEKYRGNVMYGNKLNEELKKLNLPDFQATLYNSFGKIPIQPAVETASADFKSNDDYSMAEYIKTAEWVYLLEKSIGMENVDKAFQNYFTLWKFKHPQPLDMRASFEQAIHGGLGSYFDLLHKKDQILK
ncbi:MAG: M1 family metallopeptidase [Bacteroidota bacterium]|nr:M1 family metallopeptidase [Bacteroidota bacterium]